MPSSKEPIMEETWKDIPGYEGMYQVSSFGRIRTLDRYLRASYGSRQLRRGCIIKPAVGQNGYLYIGLHRDGKTETRYVHRLVAFAFIPNPHALNEVNHIDEDKKNNHIENLEWCTHGYNINYGSARRKISESHLRGGYGKVPIIQLKDGIEVARYDSAADAERATGICASSIRKVCHMRPKFKSAGGFVWRNA